MLLALNLPLIGLWVRFLKVPYHYLAGFIVIICVIGAYSINNAAFDVGGMIFFGVWGYFLPKSGFPAVFMALAMILGRILESCFEQSLQVSAGDIGIFIPKPILAVVLFFAVMVMLSPFLKSLWSRRGIGQKI